MKTVYVLVRTDGFDINYQKPTTLEEAQKNMQDEYNKNVPDFWDESSEEMSSISDMDAILYANETVYVWKIIPVEVPDHVYVVTKSCGMNDFTDSHGDSAPDCKEVAGIYATNEKAESMKTKFEEEDALDVEELDCDPCVFSIQEYNVES